MMLSWSLYTHYILLLFNMIVSYEDSSVIVGMLS